MQFKVENYKGEIANTQDEIAFFEDEIQILEVNWVYLTCPARFQRAFSNLFAK